MRALMDNIVLVTEHIRSRLASSGRPFEHQTLTVIPCRDGQWYHLDEHGDCWRMYRFVPDSVTLDVADSPDRMYQAGLATGEFQHLLSDFRVDRLNVVLPKFHSVRWRLERLMAAVAADEFRRKQKVKSEIDAIYARADEALRIERLEAAGELPPKVTHNDTKLNNVLFDTNGKAICLIDLDTVMPGNALSDFGDAVRSGCIDVAEDESDPGNVHFRIDMFEAFTNGYLEKAADTLNPVEISLMPYSAWLLAYLMAVRFLTDFVEGDTYYKISIEDHNLVRARVQMALMVQVMHHKDEMEKVVGRLSL